MRFIIAILLLLAWSAGAATLNVPGTYATIQAAENAASAGDTILVAAGTYNEEVTINIDGSVGNYITFLADPSGARPVVRKFLLDGVDYIRIIGFEFTHVNTTYAGAIIMSGACSNVQVIDNYIHHVRGRANGEGTIVGVAGGATTSYVTVRGNTFFYLGYQAGVFSYANICAIGNDYGTADHWLIEYNNIQRSADFMYAFGEYNIVRNNYLADVDEGYWPAGGTFPHPDIDQSGSDGVVANTRYKVFEANMAGDSPTEHSHVYLQQNTSAGGDTDHLVRGNIIFNLGSGAFANINTPNYLTHNNTIYDIINFVGNNGSAYIQYGASAPTGCMFANSILHTDGGSADNIDISTGSATVVTNLGYNAGSEASYISTSDPLFTDPTSPARNFRLGSSSPARGVAANLIYITTAASSGTSFEVNNGLLLCDGKGIAEGDIVKIGSTTTRVSSISGNTVTVAASVTWGSNEVVYWNAVTSRDLGALPYGSAELTAATFVNVGGTATVTPTGDARKVWQYRSGIPIAEDYDAPFTFSHTSGDVYKVGALWAQQTPLVTATEASGSVASVLSGGATISGGATLQ